MITLLFGDNSFEVKRAYEHLIGDNKTAEVFYGEDIQVNDLYQLLTGSSLFASHRTIVIKYPSQNKPLWSEINNLVHKIDNDTNLILVDNSVDKRTLTYKTLKDTAKISEYDLWKDYEVSKAEAWLQEEIKNRNLQIDKKTLSLILDRVGLDQWQLFQALEKLVLAEKISEAEIDNLIDPSPNENIFELFENAILSKSSRVKAALFALQQNDDPFRVLSLISSQAFQLLAVFYATKNDNPAKDFAIHPFVVSKMRALAKKINETKLKNVIKLISQADTDLKSSKSEPWQIVESLLLKLAKR